MDFSKKVWNKNIKNYQKIKDMPFNKELMEGSLDKNKFAYYIEQDAHYLKYYSKVLAIISSKIDDTDNACLLYRTRCSLLEILFKSFGNNIFKNR
ncbi:hypothetical protein [Brachyspira pilosicoli]|uniref:hypothetical protein n=1 Tax=Brachyspira pilosicoli TaxID=52584 RepID=UPI001E5CE639|nr:hypothetical protein [Brachyspira pilosicoli]